MTNNSEEKVAQPEVELGWVEGSKEAEVASKLISRIESGYGKYISCYSGWYGILRALEEKLNYLDPNYRVVQVKEKFGTLRFYFESEASELVKSIMSDCVSKAEFESSLICEYCGNGGGESRIEYDASVRVRKGGWYKTLCDRCDEIRINRLEGMRG